MSIINYSNYSCFITY